MLTLVTGEWSTSLSDSTSYPLEASWTPEPVWTWWRKENTSPCQESIPGPQSFNH